MYLFNFNIVKIKFKKNIWKYMNKDYIAKQRK